MTRKKIEVVWVEDEAFNKHGFPLIVCDRCDGSGNYSYNQRDGTRCFGCGGDGWKVTKRARPAWIAFTSEVQNRIKATAKTVEVGDLVVFNQMWKRVVSVIKTEEKTGGWTEMGGVREYSYYYLIEVDGGTEITVEKVAEYAQFKRSTNGVDVNKYLAMIKPKPKQKETA